MKLKTNQTIQRLFSQLSRDILSELPPDQQARVQEALRARTEELLKGTPSSEPPTSFQDIIGLGPDGSLPFDQVSVPHIEQDFDDSVVHTQLHAAAELYYIYQHERMKVFQVVDVLLRLFHEGRMRVQSGPGARALYLVERHRPLRYGPRDRMLAYRRAFNYGTLQAPRNAVVNTGFHQQFVGFNVAVAQYFRDLLIGEVIRGSQLLNQRPFGSQATIQRIGADLRWQMDRSTYGNVVALTMETSNYLKTALDLFETPDIKKSFDANNKWDVIEVVSQRHLGGAAEIASRSKMADAGRMLLNYVANDPFKTRDFQLFQAQIQPLGTVAEEWIAAYRMTSDGRNFRGVTPTLQRMLGTAGSPSGAAG